MRGACCWAGPALATVMWAAELWFAYNSSFQMFTAAGHCSCSWAWVSKPALLFALGCFHQMHGRAILPDWLSLVMSAAHSFYLTKHCPLSTARAVQRLVVTQVSFVYGPRLLDHLLRRYLGPFPLAANTIVSPHQHKPTANALETAPEQPSSRQSWEHDSYDESVVACAAERATAGSPATGPPLLKPGGLIRQRRGLPPAVPASILEGLSDGSQAPYRSPLAGRTKMCIKVNTDKDMTDLPTDINTQLQAALHGIGYHTPQLLDLSIRSGCICLTLDVLLDAVQDLGDVSDATAMAQAFAGLLAPLLDPLTPADGRSAPEPMRFQVGGVVLCACWDASAQSWSLQPLQNDATSDDSARAVWAEQARQMRQAFDPHQHKSIIQRLVSSNVQFGSVRQQQEQPGDVTGISCPSTINKQSGSAAGQAAAGGSVQLCIQAQLLGDLHTLPDIQGWTSAPAGQHEPTPGAATSAAARFLVRYQSGYINTEVTRVACDAAGGQSVSVWQVRVQVPDSWLPRHHPGGPLLAFAPVVLELWTRELLLDSAPLLLSLHNPHHSSCPHPGACCWWWWGASPHFGVQPALLELHSMNQWMWQATAQASTAALPHVHGHHTFITDTITWLTHVKRVCQSSQCCMMKPVSISGVGTAGQGHLLHTPTLNKQLLLSLGRDLVSHARRHKLHHLEDLLTHQLALVTRRYKADRSGGGAAAGQGRGSAGGGSDGGAAAGGGGELFNTCARLVSQLVTSATGYSCLQCERLYQERLSVQYGRVQPFASLALACMSTVVVLRAVIQFGLLQDMVALPHTVMSAMVFWQYTRSGCRTSQCSWAGVGAYLYRLLVEVLQATGAVSVMHTLVLQYGQTQLLWVGVRVSASIGEQAQSVALLPAPLVTCLAFLEVVNQLGIAYRCNHRPPSLLFIIGLLLSVLLPRLLLDMQMRGLLMDRSPAAHTAAQHALAALPTSSPTKTQLSGDVRHMYPSGSVQPVSSSMKHTTAAASAFTLGPAQQPRQRTGASKLQE